MKKWYSQRVFFLGAIASLTLLATPLQAQLILTENFDYPCCGPLSGNGNWSNTGSGTNINTTSPGLVFAGYANSNIGNAILLQNISGRGATNPVSASISGGSIFAGFLIQVNTAPATGQLIMNFDGNGPGEHISTGFTIRDNAGLRFGLYRNGTTTFSSLSISYGSPYLVVVEYYQPLKEYRLYINPVIDGLQPTHDLTTGSLAGGSGMTNVFGLELYQNSGGNVIIDGLRVGTSWSSVVTSNPAGGGGGGLLFQESFSSTSGTDLNTLGWTNYDCCGPITVDTPGLTYPGFGGSGNSVRLQCCSTSGYTKSLSSSVGTGTVYASFLIQRIVTASNNNEAMLNFHSPGWSTGENSNYGFVLDDNQLSIKDGSCTGCRINGPFLSGGSPGLVVLAYNFGSSQFELYYNPSVGGISPPVPNITANMGGSQPTFIDGINLIRSSSGANVLIDEIRVSTNWADVVAVGEPSNQPTSFSVSSTSSTSISGSFTPASSNPNGYLVVRKTGTPITGVPADNTFYNLFDPVGDGTVVSVGSSTNFFDNTLTAGITAYYNIYSYNTDFSTNYNYLQSAPLQGIAATDVSGPPTNLLFSNVQSNQMDISFTAAPAPVDGYIVLRNTFSNQIPTDRTSYSVGDLVNGTSYVAYIGPLTGFTDTGLNPATNYTYDVYAYSGSGSFSNYYTQTQLTASRSTLSTSPTAQPTALSFTNRTEASVTANFTPAVGFPQGYLVIYRAGSSPTNGAPVDGVNYSIGNPLGGGFVGSIDNSTSPTIALPGPAGTQFFFDVYSYNGSGSTINYYQSVPPFEGSAFTLMTEPTAQPSSVTFNTVTSSGFNVAFTAASPVPTGGYIALRNTSTVFDTPVDGTTYSVGNTIGSSTVAYIGTALTFSQASLSPNSTYHYKIFSYGGSVPSTENYFLGLTPPINNTTTLANTPTATAAGSVTQTSFTANWNSVTGGSAGYRLDVASDVGFTTLVVNNLALGSGATSSPVSGLVAGTTYYYRVRSVNTSSAPSPNSNVITVVTVPPNPVASAATAMTTTSFSANWAASTTATGYFLDVSTVNTFASFVTGYNNLSVGNVTTASVTALTAGTTYYYRVRAANASGTSSNSITITVLLVSPPPTANAASAISTTGFTANWSASTGAASYRLDVATDNGFSVILGSYNNLTVVGTSQTVTGLTAGTTYYYRVRAFNASGTSTNSGTITTITLCSPPTSSAGTVMTTTSFTANWGAVTGATNYRLDVATDNTFISLVAGYNDLTVAGTSQSVTGLIQGTTYYYRVRASNASGVSANSSTITVLLVSPPPTANAASAFSTTGFTANWSASTGAASYRLDVATDAGVTAFVAGYNNLTVASTSQAVTGLTAGTTYYYRVRAFNTSGTSVNSNTITTITLCIAPTASAGTAMTTTSFTANWGAVAGATNYRLDVATENTFVSLVTGYNNLTVTGTTQSVTGLTPGTTYYYRVRASNASGVSINSGAITVLLLPAAPLATAATSPSVSNFTANWNASNGAASYRLDVSTDNFSTYFSTYNNFTVAGLSQVITGLTSGTTYHYRVRAVNGTGTSANSNTISIIALPAGPIASSGASVTNNSFVASWSTIVGTTDYSLEISTDNFSTFLPGYGPLTTTSTSQAVTGLSPGVTYQYRVRANNMSGASANSNVVQVTLLANTPVAVAATSVGTVSFTANWNIATGATGYELDVSADNFSTLISGYNPLILTGSSQAVTGLQPGGTYQFRVRASTLGGLTINSNSISVLLLPIAPLALPAANTSQVSFTATWNSVSGATEGYLLDVSTNSVFSSFLPGYNSKAIASTSDEVAALTAGTTYYYQVRAKNATGPSTYSNVITVITLPDPPSGLVAEQIATDGFLATWLPVAGAAGYKLDISKDNFVTFAAGYEGKDVGNVSEEFVTGLLSSTLYRFRVRSYNAINGESGNSSFKSVRTSGGVVTTPQISSVTFLDKFSGGANEKIAVTISGGEGQKILRFLRRNIQSSTFIEEIINPASQASYEFTIQDAWLDKVGMEFYFSLSDELDKSTESSRKFIYRTLSQEPIPNLATGGTADSYRIFSVPVKLDDNSIQEIFKSVESQYGGYDKTKWRLVHYEGGKNVDYTEGLNKIDQGKGYWFNSKDNVSVKISGSVIPLDQSNPFKLPLNQGWTQIGNPYPFEISWVDVLDLNNNPAGVGKLFTYDAASVSFKESGGLKAWEGGFVKSENSATINIPVTVKQSASGRSKGYPEIVNRDLFSDEWFLPLTLHSGNAYNEMGGIGMHPDAKQSNDRHDEQSLPRFVRYLELNSYHPEHFLPRFTRDVVPSAMSYNWEFVVESNFDEKEIMIKWDSKSLGNNDAQLLLYDMEANILVDMKNSSEYHFEINEKHRLKFFYSMDGKSLLPDITGIGRPYPNPSSAGITIPFVAGANSPELQIAVYDLMGKQVKLVAAGRFEPGIHEVIWDGNDAQNVRVAQGVYIYRLTSADTPAQLGRVILK